MKPFKFFQGAEKEPVYRSLPRNNIFTQRQYVGLTRGQIKWIEQPTGMVYYLNPTIGTDPMNEDSMPEVTLQLLSETIFVESRNVPSFEYFMEQNYNKYIFVYQVIDLLGNVYTSEETIPRGVPLIIRCVIKD